MPHLRLHALIAASLLAAVLAACGSSTSAPAAGAGGATTGGDTPASDIPLDAAAYVDPFVSTADDYGQDLPGAYVPNGLAKVNPMSWPYRAHSGYNYPIPEIAGFTHTNLDGVGSSGGGGDLLVAPMKGAYLGSKRPLLLGDPAGDLGSLPYAAYAKFFSHRAETARPGYYQVKLLDANPDLSSLSGLLPGAIDAEMTADTRSGWDRYRFPDTATTASLIVDLSSNFHRRLHATVDVSTLPDGRIGLQGRLDGNFYTSDYTLYYYAETTAPAASVRTWGPDGALSGAGSQSGTDVGVILQFDTRADKVVGLKITLSPISAEQARIDQAKELGSRTFDEVRASAYQQWNDLLARVRVTASSRADPDGTLQKLFYTHLYKMFGTPVNATSTTGLYRGVDGQIREASAYVHYDGFTTWDDYRKYAVIALVAPQRYADMTRSMVDLFADLAPTGQTDPAALVQAVPTVRFERSAVVIADAVAKGVELPRLAEAYPALKAFSNGLWDEDNTRLGYFPGQVSDLLGTAYDDWAMSRIARALGKTSEADALAQRATRYRNIFNRDGWTSPRGTRIGLLWPRAADGSWNEIDPEAFGPDGLYQGTLWQYNWYDTADLGGLMQLMGGQAPFAEAVSFFFGEQAPEDCSRMLHSNANEVDLIGAYLFDYAGKPSRTQYWVRQIFGGSSCNRYIASGDAFPYALTRNGEYLTPRKMEVYRLQPAGFLPTMDNDAGTMSSMFVAAALGLFPASPGFDTYAIGSPFFDRVTLPTADGGSFTIAAKDVSPDAYYIQSAQLGPCPLQRSWIRYADIVSGASLDFAMGSAASDWAEDGALPPSLSDSLPVEGWAPRSEAASPACPQLRSARATLLAVAGAGMPLLR
ncbi:glycoside hydrolase domain-containing protein [Solimonas flava]|uniref:glycoside hydrolase domain-containing protein n=1 Tax=Solimonas flava TaxID=415849 RepID=UPI0006875DCB|nr:glycoside hydrolase domain-containing protein [Solimonas flava]